MNYQPVPVEVPVFCIKVWLEYCVARTFPVSCAHFLLHWRALHERPTGSCTV